MTQPLDMLCWTPCFQRGRKQKSLTLSSISRASFTKQVQTGTQSPYLGLPFTLGLTSGRCWLFYSLFPWLVYANQAPLAVSSVLFFGCCLEGRPCACPWERPSVFLPDIPDSGGMAACAKDTPSKPDMNLLKWFICRICPACEGRYW